jgi:hypothetical protein
MIKMPNRFLVAGQPNLQIYENATLLFQELFQIKVDLRHTAL